MATGTTLNKSLLDVIQQNVGRITTGTLQKCLNHGDPFLRAQATDELKKRGSLPLPAALQLVTDDSRVVRERAFYCLIDHGAAPTPAEIRSQLSAPIFPLSVRGERVNPDEVIVHYFSKQSLETLWRCVDLVDDNSYLALRVLGQRFLATNRSAIRNSLVEDFEQRVTAAKARRNQQSGLLPSYFPILGQDPVEAERQNLRTTALQILATNPDPSDKALFQRFLSSELSAIDQTIACLRGLCRVGQPGDLQNVEPLLSSASSSVRAAAARTYLSLASNLKTAISDLIREKSEPTVWVIVATALQTRNREAWEQLKPLLADANDQIRRLVCHYVTSLLERRDIYRALQEYLKSEAYYYNVVTLFDRTLYAPIIVRRYLRQQEIQHFAKLSKEATRGWPGLHL